ncbi:MAG TPA: alpha/beta hydrolase [Thermoleophilaceae bacterium]|jgi:pimeloyl-ACP methyl ester carboxylesterase|nr:alpha/beta hydrolase [Thermoleophilaceae bacterium]
MKGVTRSPLAEAQTLRLEDGRRLAVRRWPGDAREPLVMLHGLFDSSEGWSPLCQRLSGACLAFDLPGFGCSDPPSHGSLAGYARDIAEGLDMLGVDQITLVGHSLGGAVAAALAELIAERVRALVLLAPAGFGRIPLLEAFSLPGVRELSGLALPVVLSSRLAVAAAYMTVVSNGKWPERDLLERVTGLARGRSIVAGVREATRSMTNGRRQEQAFELRRMLYDGPVHAVWGTRDRVVPRSHSDGVLVAFPQAQIHVWDGMGHHHVRERIDDLIELIQEATADGRGQAARRRLADAA